MDMGRVSTAELAEAVRSRELDGLPETLAAAVAEAREVLDTTRDPQLSDIVLDRWCLGTFGGLSFPQAGPSDVHKRRLIYV